MTVVIIGKILSQNLMEAVIEDSDDKGQIKCKLTQEALDESEIGESAIFVGKKTAAGYLVDKIEIRKFLDPLHEEEVMENSNFALVSPITNPFPEEFEKATK